MPCGRARGGAPSRGRATLYCAGVGSPETPWNGGIGCNWWPWPSSAPGRCASARSSCTRPSRPTRGGADPASRTSSCSGRPTPCRRFSTPSYGTGSTASGPPRIAWRRTRTRSRGTSRRTSTDAAAPSTEVPSPNYPRRPAGTPRRRPVRPSAAWRTPASSVPSCSNPVSASPAPSPSQEPEAASGGVVRAVGRGRVKRGR